jgi:hypothetical protein
VATTDSDHDCPIFPDLAHNRIATCKRGSKPREGRVMRQVRRCFVAATALAAAAWLVPANFGTTQALLFNFQ